MRADIADWGQLLGGAVPPSSGAKQPMAPPSGGGGGSLGKAKAQRSYDDARNIISQGDAWSKIFTTLGKTIKSWDKKADAMMLSRLETSLSGLGVDILFNASAPISDASEEQLKPASAQAFATKLVGEKLDAWEKSKDGQVILENEYVKEIYDGVGKQKTIDGIVANLAPLVKKEFEARLSIHEQKFIDNATDDAVNIVFSSTYDHLDSNKRQIFLNKGATPIGDISSANRKSAISGATAQYEHTKQGYRNFLQVAGYSQLEIKNKLETLEKTAQMAQLDAMLSTGYKTASKFPQLKGGIKGWQKVFPKIPYKELSKRYSGFYKDGRALTEKELKEWAGVSVDRLNLGTIAELEEMIGLKYKDLKTDDRPYYSNLRYLSEQEFVNAQTLWMKTLRTAKKKEGKPSQEEKDAWNLAVSNWHTMATSEESIVLKQAILNPPHLDPAHQKVFASLSPTERGTYQTTFDYLSDMQSTWNELQSPDGPSITGTNNKLKSFNPTSQQFIDRYKDKIIDSDTMNRIFTVFSNKLSSLVREFEQAPVSATTSVVGDTLSQNPWENAEIVSDEYQRLTNRPLTTYLTQTDIDERTAIVSNFARKGDYNGLIQYMAGVEKDINDVIYSSGEFKDKLNWWMFHESGIFTPLQVAAYLSKDAPESKAWQQSLANAIQLEASTAKDNKGDSNVVTTTGIGSAFASRGLEFSYGGEKGIDAIERYVFDHGTKGLELHHHWFWDAVLFVGGRYGPLNEKEALDAILRGEAEQHTEGPPAFFTTDRSDTPLVHRLDRTKGVTTVGPLNAFHDSKTRERFAEIVTQTVLAQMSNPNYTAQHIRGLTQETYRHIFHKKHIVPQRTKNPLMIDKAAIADIAVGVNRKEMAYAVHAELNDAIQSGEFAHLKDTEALRKSGFSPSAIEIIQRGLQRLFVYGDPVDQVFGFETGTDGNHFLAMYSNDSDGVRHKVILRKLDASGKQVPYTKSDQDFGQRAIDTRVYRLLIDPDLDGVVYPLSKDEIQDAVSNDEPLLTHPDADPKDIESAKLLDAEQEWWNYKYLTSDTVPDSFESKEELIAFLLKESKKLAPIDTLTSTARLKDLLGISNLTPDALKGEGGHHIQGTGDTPSGPFLFEDSKIKTESGESISTNQLPGGTQMRLQSGRRFSEHVDLEQILDNNKKDGVDEPVLETILKSIIRKRLL